MPGLLVVVSGCSSSHVETKGDAAPLSPPAATVEYLSASDHLVRASMTLRGLRPSVADIQAVQADATQLPAIVDRYLAGPELGATIRDLHNESLLSRTAVQIFPAGFKALPPIQTEAPGDVDRAVAEAPLRLVEYVVTKDRPYTEIVTADYTLANRVVRSVWSGLPADGIQASDGGADDWQVVYWDDGRDAAGVLSDSWLFTRHSTTPSNANRGRANAVSRALLCDDFLDREVKLDTNVNLSDPNAVASAVSTTPACASCHQTLDPLAAYFDHYRLIYVPGDVAAYPTPVYAALDVLTSIGITMRSPSYFGDTSPQGIRGLGQAIANDPRFSLCAARRFYAYFNQVALADVPVDAAAALQSTFIASGMNAKALIRAIVLDDAFRVAAGTTDDTASTLVGVRKARPRELVRMMADLTGYRWQIPDGQPTGHEDLLADSFFGFEVLSGGIDAFYVTRPSYTYNATASLTLRALAGRAAVAVVAADFAIADASQRKLLSGVGPGDTSEDAVRAELVALHLRLYAETVQPNDDSVNDAYALFSAALAATNDPRRAWTATLAGMLEDSRIAFY